MSKRQTARGAVTPPKPTTPPPPPPAPRETCACGDRALLLAELAELHAIRRRARDVVTAWDTDCPEGVHDSMFGAMDALRAALGEAS